MNEFLLLLVPVVIFMLLFLLILMINSIAIFGSWSLMFVLPMLVFICWCLVKLLLLFKKDTKFKV